MKKLTVCLALACCCTAATAQEVDSLRMDSIIHTLPDVMVKGERPLVKVEGSAMIYDLPRMVEQKAIDNVYEALKELPGVTEQGESLLLSGRPVNIIFDGKVTTMTAQQLYATLRAMPAGRIDKVEVLYNAPARYQLRGAVINVKLKHQTDNKAALQGEVNLAWNQEHTANFGERASLLYNKGPWAVDFMWKHSHGKDFGVTDETSLHTLNNGSTHDISTREVSRYRSHGDNFRLGIDYNIAKEHRLSLVYSGNYEKNNSRQEVSGSIEANFRIHSSDRLHNVRLDYQAPFGLKAGAELTYYHNPETQWLASTLPTGTLNYEITNSQRINRWKFFIAREHKLKHGWGINYGTTYTTSHDNSSQLTAGTGDRVSQREDNVNAYFGLNRNFSAKLMMDASLAAEYYHSPLWHRWDLFPTLNLTWLPAQGHVLQFGLSSDKAYPEYWAMNNFVTYSNGGYNEITGNPRLKPSVEYQAQAVYILRSKYQFVAWFKHTRDYFIQAPYQRADRLTIEYRYLNFNYQQQAGLQASAPFKIGRWLDSRLTLIGVWMREKDDDFHDLSLDRSVAYVMATMRNTFTLSRRPDIVLTADGMIHSKANQGTYDLPGSGYLNLGLRYRFCKQKATLKLFCNDIFRTATINPRVDYKGQHLTMNFACYRTFGISFTYSFGGFKEQKHTEVDTSRFKK